MDAVTTMLDVLSGLDSVCTDTMVAIVNDRGRGYASDSEAWAEIRATLERVKEKLKDAEDCHKEMWKSIKSGDEDACSALCQQLYRELALCGQLGVQGSAMCRIAVMGEDAAKLMED